MGRHVVIGAGPVGTAVAELLLSRGEEVRVITRSGSGVDGAEKIAADASDRDRLIELTADAAVIYNCVNPPYDRWITDWPPIAAAILAAAEANGAVLATCGNLYVYGEIDAPMAESTPMKSTGIKGKVRIGMWTDALAAHNAGRVRAFEVRGGDYLGGNSLLGLLITPALRKGRTAFVPADLDAPHTWTNVRDVAALMVAGGTDSRAWGKVWHVPSAPACSIRDLTTIAAAQLAATDPGVKAKVRSLPYVAVWVGGLFNPLLKELRETQHQFRKPFILDSSAAEKTFGLRATPIEESVAFDIEHGTSTGIKTG
jgi:nucleoside-diphosphate-sugar epimerase